MENNISLLRKNVFELRGKLSPEIDKKISKLAQDLRYIEKWYYEDVLRRAIGNSLPEPADIIIEGVHAYNRFYELLVTKFSDDKTLRRFEQDYIKKVLDNEEEYLPKTWTSLLTLKLSQSTSDKILILYENYGKELLPEVMRIDKSPYLSKPAFQVYEEHLNKILDEAIRECANEEIKTAGITVFDENQIAVDDVSVKNKLKNTGRLLLTPNEREVLNEKIVIEVNNYHDAGEGTLQKAFEYLSKNSKNILGINITIKQIEGRYNRHKKRYDC